MPKRRTIISLTVVAWIIGISIYAYHWVTWIMSDPNLHDYEGIWTLPLLGFFVDSLPYLLIGLIVLVIAELILIPGSDGRLGKMV